jgi:hypothetical protein
MSDLSSLPPDPKTSLANGAWSLAAFAAVCAIAAGHTMISGIFPFVALAAATTMGIAVSNSATRR